MKSSRNYFLQKLSLHQICLSVLFGLMAACSSAPILAQATLTMTLDPTATPLSPFQYTVFSGETCESLAFNFNVSEKSIIELNNLQPSCQIKPGQQLLIPYPTVSNVPTLPPQPVEIVKATTTLDFYRNEKKYIVTIATSHFIFINRDLYDSLTPPPKLPEKPSDSIVFRAKIKEALDLDNDGEQEYVVLLNECTGFDCTSFVSYIRIYKYNPEKDDYYVFDESKTDPEEIKPEISY